MTIRYVLYGCSEINTGILPPRDSQFNWNCNKNYKCTSHMKIKGDRMISEFAEKFAKSHGTEMVWALAHNTPEKLSHFESIDDAIFTKFSTNFNYVPSSRGSERMSRESREGTFQIWIISYFPWGKSEKVSFPERAAPDDTLSAERGDGLHDFW